MPSLIPGYNYDIFISYRQKDNKYDGWVTEFVGNLKKELEATFKEEISVYFDINQHDGLLETHDVDESLKDKLKCLVLIPVISRTYCDPKSFAWEHEFRVFIELASKDRFGLKVKLPNGNVASRVLPIRIHDLEDDDIKLVESYLDFIRSIDFIYHSQGVNRPLRQKDDDVIHSSNQPVYRDQINKAANAIKEILRGIENVQSALVKGQIDNLTLPDDIRTDDQYTVKPAGNKKGKIFYTSFSTILIIALIAFYLFTSGSKLPFSKRDWILITDFENLTDDPVFDKSLYTAFSLTVSQSRYINVFPRLSMIEVLARMEMPDSTFVDERIGREMATREGIAFCIIPTISNIGNKYAVGAKIMETQSGDLLRSEILFSQTRDEILPVLDQISKKIRLELGESRFSIFNQDKPLSKVTTSSLEALKAYSIGIDHHIRLDFERARESYEAALRIDTGFVSAKASLGSILFQKFDTDKGQKLLDEAVRSLDKLTEREKLKIHAAYAAAVIKDLNKAIEYSRTIIDLYPDDIAAHNNLGWFLQTIGEYEQASKEYKEVIRIDSDFALTYGNLIWTYFDLGKLDSVIIWSEKMITRFSGNMWGYAYLGTAWCGLDSLRKAISYFEKAEEIDPNNLYSLYRHAHTCRLLGDYSTAIILLDHVLKVNSENNQAYYLIGVNYLKMGKTEDAENYFKTYQKAITRILQNEYPENYSTCIKLAAVSARLGEMANSQEYLLKAMNLDSTRHSEFAGIFCLQGNIPKALDEFQKAFKNGYRDIASIKMDPDLEILKYDIRFHSLMNTYINKN